MEKPTDLELEEVACACCTGTRRRVLFSARDTRYPDTSPHPFHLVECLDCGLRYLNPRPVGESLDLFYPAAYYAPRLADRQGSVPESRTGGWKGWLRRLRPPRKVRQQREKLGHVRRATPSGGTVLEIGPGGGDFMLAMEKSGFRVLGVDRSTEIAELLHERVGLEVFPVETADRNVKPGSIDTVVLWNALEHIPDPAALLRRIHGWLRSRGSLLLSVPNAAALERILFFRGDPCEDIPRHLYSFTPRSLRALLEANGFAEVRFRHRTLCSSSELQSRIEARWFGAGRGTWIRRPVYLGIVLPSIWLLDRFFALSGRSHTMVAQARRAGRETLGVTLLLTLTILLAAGTAAATLHRHATPDGRETAACTCRPATEAERGDPAISPDGWVQDEPRETFNRGDVPLPLVPDWTGSRARATGGLCWGDIDDDGDLDLVVGTYWGNMYPPIPDYYNFAYRNTGGVLEADPSWISIDERHTTDVRVGRINDDAYPDFLFGNGGESLHPSQVFYGTAGLLPAVPGWSSNDNCWTVGCALADFDADGDLDLATANQGNTADPYRPVHLFRNTGDGLEAVPFWQSAQVGITNAADWGDMDGDGWLDLAVSGWVNWQTGVFRNVAGTVTPDFVWTSGHPDRTDKGIGWARVDGDAWPDLAVGGNGDPDWLFHNEEGMLASSAVWASEESYHGCQDLVWVDIDRDGDEDLATINFGNGHARIYLNNAGVLSTLADWQYDAASSGTAIAFGDVNDDGMPDLAIGVANGPNMLFLNTGTPMGVAEDLQELPGPGRVRLLASPQPARGSVAFRLEGGTPLSLERIVIVDIAGRRAAELRPTSGAMRRTRVVPWSSGTVVPGIYFAVAEGVLDDGRPFRVVRRIVVLGR